MKNYEQSPTRTKYCLNGFWDFSIAADGITTLPEIWEEQPIQVPSPYNINAFTRSNNRRYQGEEIYVQGGDFRLYPEYPVEWERAKCGFYRRTIDVTEEMLRDRVFLHLDAVAFHCMMYVNGVRIAETMEAFLPIDLELTDYIHAGENELIVACESASYLTYKGKDGRNRLDYPRGSFWGEFVSGIWQDAWLITRPRAYVDDVFAVSDIYKRELSIRYTSLHADDCTVAFTLKKWNTDETPRTILSTDASSGEAVWIWDEGEVALWDFLQPNLYELTAVLSRDGVVVDEKTTRIGFRTMTAEGEKFILNGSRINLKIDAWHYMGYTIQTEEYAREYYKMALDAGVNIIRLHAEPFPEFFIDIADEMGMLIVSESAVWASHCSFSYSPPFFENAKKHLIRMLLRDRNHPSVVMWSPENECIPAFMFCGSDYIQSIPELEEAVYDFLKITYDYDTSRLISCDGSGDLGGRLPVNSLHYPHYDCPTKRGKPITIGEMGSMYYSTPDTVTKEFGRAALDSFDGRLQSVADEAYNDLIGERKWASQICVFNLIWYGLYPMPFQDRKLTYDDYTTPGIKPSRITPYMRTLNAGAEAALPAYLPNPVWRRMQDAYLEVRAFPEFFPQFVWAGDEESYQVTVFNDRRTDEEFRLLCTFTGENFSFTDARTLTIKATEYTEERIPFTAPRAGDVTFTATLLRGGTEIHSFTETIRAVDRAAWQADMDATGVRVVTDGELPENTPVLDCRRPAPYADFMKPTHQKHFFANIQRPARAAYRRPVSCYQFESSLCFGAKPVLMNGSGDAIAVSLACAGENRILSGLDCTKDDATTAQITLYLAKTLAAETVVKPEKPYYLGDPNAPTAVLLGELGCEFELLTMDEFMRLLRKPTDRLLIVDGTADFNHYEWISDNNFRRVLITAPQKAPQLFRNELSVTDRKLFHLTASQTAEITFGVTSNALYGLEANRETILGDGALEYHYDSAANAFDGLLFGTPNVNWNNWNNVGEPVKTVAIHRSGMRDNHRIGALAEKTYAGSRFWITTLATTVDSAKIKNIWARLLSGFGVALEMRANDERTNLLASGMYASHVRKMLLRTATADEDVTAAYPSLNNVEHDSGWRIVEEKFAQERDNALYALYVSSPTDRRDLLLNPDFIDLSFSADADAKVYLNGALLGAGTQFDVTGIPLIGGVNTLLVHIPEKSSFPKITFKRVKTPQLDLSFSLSGASLSVIPMQGVRWDSTVNQQYNSHASFTREHFWSTNESQRPGISLDFRFPAPISVRALWYVAIKFHEEGHDFMPRKYRILAGEDADHLSVVYTSLSEKEMCYPRGRVYLELPEVVTAQTFRYELLEDAPKEFVMSDLTLLG